NGFKQSVGENWVKEEIKHIPSGGTEPEKLMLDAHLFWNALQEPQTGLWDSSLQTIPDIVGAINRTHIPIIDPERVAKERLLLAPDAKLYNSLYTIRQEQLDNQRADYFSWLVPFNVEAFKQILNHINTGDKNEDYDLEPEYVDLAKLIDDFNNTDAFKRNKAVMVLEDAFALSADAFSTILPVMNAYQSNNPSQRPNTVELRTVTDLFVTAFKRKQLYFTGDLGTGWIEEEVTGTFSGGNNELVKYYSVLNMTLDNVRGSRKNRTEWQRTLAEWNRVPTVFPDIVPPENINRFVQSEIVHDLWINRKNTLDNAYNQANLAFNDTLDVDSLFTTFKTLLSAIALRTQTPPVTDYSDYITVLFDKEDNGEDIRPYLNQLTIFIGEYRVLRQVYEVLESEYNDDPMTNSNLLPSEYEDVNNIGVRINFANSGTYFSYVNEEYSENIVLSGADFQNYKPSEINFPLILVQETTQWRSPLADKKAWKDTLET
ncbi:MAG TPA: hypothetical protein PLP27_13240, partial [Crocinitomicaceae bacterium]|nr:hypothetical protein [Crocinitomicaceae bacterium]